MKEKLKYIEKYYLHILLHFIKEFDIDSYIKSDIHKCINIKSFYELSHIPQKVLISPNQLIINKWDNFIAMLFACEICKLIEIELIKKDNHILHFLLQNISIHASVLKNFYSLYEYYEYLVNKQGYQLKVEAIFQIISTYFLWKDTQQGYNYWYNAHCLISRLYRKSFDDLYIY